MCRAHTRSSSPRPVFVRDVHSRHGTGRHGCQSNVESHCPFSLDWAGVSPRFGCHRMTRLGSVGDARQAASSWARLGAAGYGVAGGSGCRLVTDRSVTTRLSGLRLSGKLRERMARLLALGSLGISWNDTARQSKLVTIGTVTADGLSALVESGSDRNARERQAWQRQEGHVRRR